MREPTAIAFAGDWHMSSSWGVKAIRYAAEQGVDTILHVGDFGFTFAPLFVSNIEQACTEYGVMIYFVPGNHDDHRKIWDKPLDDDGFFYFSDHMRGVPQGFRWKWWGLTFLGLGGAASVDKQWRTPFVDWWPTELITPTQAWKAKLGGEVDIMVAHDCPSGVPIPGISFESGIRFFPAEALHRAEAHREIVRDVVDAVKPKLFVHGHYHVDYNWFDYDSLTQYVGLNMDYSGFDKNLWIVREPTATLYSMCREESFKMIGDGNG